ncbi:periplasmic chaperone for outer membrane proteins Skp [Pseudidiomarina woesei]|uniref:Periplasmic chaperone for outer membrane proteins Skp n=2 Tax=Pseudidiomarina woesei TaxID=1381080 RepID=A0A0K6GWH6_9GAMM|nr:periplasmic chaperone for outer membrane proteins Skp [Pseudidiomarina woesei]
MNKMVKTSIAAALLSTALFANAAEAQQKIGYVNMQQVLINLPQARNLEQQVQEEFKGRISEIEEIEGKMQALQDKAERDSKIMSQREMQDMGRELELLDATRQVKAKGLREDMQRRGNELRDQLMAEVMRNAQALASEQKYDVVLSSNSLVYANENFDLTDDVLKKMTGGN